MQWWRLYGVSEAESKPRIHWQPSALLTLVHISRLKQPSWCWAFQLVHIVLHTATNQALHCSLPIDIEGWIGT